MRLFAEVRELFALSLLLLLAAAPWARAEEHGNAPPPGNSLPSYTLPANVPWFTIEKRRAPMVSPNDSTPALADCPDEAEPLEVASEGTLESHRRGAEKKKRAQTRLTSADEDSPTATPMERLQQLCSGDVVLQPIIVRSTLSEAMGRVALWGECCPVCGRQTPGKERGAAAVCESQDRLTDKKMLDLDKVESDSSKPASAEPLRAGEPAQVILDTQKRLGKSVTDGTEFGGSPELLIRWIRILDEENRRQKLALRDPAPAEPTEAPSEEESVYLQMQVEALRKACRQLQETADLLEEQNLFESADSIRGFADALRRQSRHKLKELNSTSDGPAGAPRQANAKAAS